MSKFKFFVSQDKFSIIAQIFLKFANVQHNWKIQNWKIILKNSWKIGTPFDRQSWKIVSPLAYWHTKLDNWYTFGTLACLLARWHVKNETLARVWHFGNLAHEHVDHAGTHGTCGTQFSKLIYALWKCKCDHENYN